MKTKLVFTVVAVAALILIVVVTRRSNSHISETATARNPVVDRGTAPPVARANGLNPRGDVASVSNTLEGTSPVPTAGISDFRTYVNRQPRTRMTLEILKSVKPEDVDWLLETYQSEPDVTKRGRAGLGLALTGDQRAFEAIQRTLFTEFNGRDLNDREIRAMAAQVKLIGTLSRKNPAAIDFLVQHSHPDAWKHGEIRKWNALESTEEYTDSLLAVRAIQGLGDSDRPEALAALAGIARRPPTELSGVAGAVQDGIFAQSYIAEHGIDGWDTLRFKGARAVFQQVMDWQQTEEGIQWNAWISAVEKQQYEKLTSERAE